MAGKKIAMIIAFREFQDEEYFIPKQILKTAGAEITTSSASLGKAIGGLGGEAEVNILIKDLRVADYDAILFIGGPGAQKYIDDEDCYQIAREVIKTGKVLGAICIAPIILAKAWSSPMDKFGVKLLRSSGAVYQSEPVVTDGKLVTADGPMAAKKFAETIINLLNKNG